MQDCGALTAALQVAANVRDSLKLAYKAGGNPLPAFFSFFFILQDTCTVVYRARAGRMAIWSSPFVLPMSFRLLVPSRALPSQALTLRYGLCHLERVPRSQSERIKLPPGQMPTFTAVALLCLVPTVFAQLWVPRLDLTTTGPLFTAIQDGSTKVEQLVAGFAADPLQTVPLVPEAVLLAAGTCLDLAEQPIACLLLSTARSMLQLSSKSLDRHYVWIVTA